MIATIFDTETTGLIENRSLPVEKQIEVIDFYACRLDLATGAMQAEFDTLLKPRKAIPEFITKITHIDNAMVANAPRFEQKADEIIAMLQSAPVVIAHNASFDVEAIEIECDRIGKRVAWPHVLCTVEQTIHLKGFRLSMTNLHQHLFGEPFADAHRAKPDTQALIRCCVELHARGLL